VYEEILINNIFYRLFLNMLIQQKTKIPGGWRARGAVY
jgi:hypothetical protein